MLRKIIGGCIFLIIFQVSMAGIVIGNPHGKVILLEVTDYQCLHCHTMQPKINWLLAHNHQLKIRIFPVAAENQTSLIQATAAYVLAKHNGNFLAYHESLLAQAHNPEQTFQLLNKLGVYSPAFVKEMHQPWVLTELEKGNQLLKKFQSGMPLILIYPSSHPNKVVVFRGDTDLNLLQRVINRVSP